MTTNNGDSVFMANIRSIFKRNASTTSFEALIAPHMDALYRQAFRYMGNAEEAEDLQQELLLDIVQKQTQLRAAKVPAAWLSRCLYHRFIDGYRKQQRQPQTQALDTIELSQQPIEKGTPEADYQYHQVLKLLQLLSPEQRMAVSLHDIEGYSLPELAETMAIPLGTLKSHLHRGRKALKQHMRVQPFE